MPTPSLLRFAVLGAVLTGTFPPVSEPVAAQSAPERPAAPTAGIGYVGNAPRLMGGVGGYVILPALGGFGVYADVKFNLDDPEDDLAYRPGLTSAQAEAELDGLRYLTGESSWQSANVALVRPLTPALMAYAGLGYSRSTHYRFYEQVVFEVGNAVVVKDPDGAEKGVNVLGGFMFRLTPLVTSQIGFETRPVGFTVGVSLRLPPT